MHVHTRTHQTDTQQTPSRQSPSRLSSIQGNYLTLSWEGTDSQWLVLPFRRRVCGGGTATNLITQTPVSAWADSQFHEWNQIYPARGLGVEERQCVYISRLHLVNTFFFSLWESSPKKKKRDRLWLCVCLSSCSLTKHWKWMQVEMKWASWDRWQAYKTVKKHYFFTFSWRAYIRVLF